MNNFTAISVKAAKKIFIKEMNKKAKQIGMDDSYFVEPAGFPSTLEQVMTTRDMLKMVIHALGYKEIGGFGIKNIYHEHWWKQC